MLSLSSSVVADVLEVNIWKAMPGKNELLTKYAHEARAIQQELGSNSAIGRDTDGRIHTANSFKNWAAWAAHGEKLQGSKKWGKFLAKISKKPSAELENNYLLNTPVGAMSGGSVYQVFIWKAELGRASDMFQVAMEARAIHEKSGTKVDIHVDQMQNMHYVMNYANWADWAKMQDTPNPEFQAFLQRQGAAPTAQLIKVYTAGNL